MTDGPLCHRHRGWAGRGRTPPGWLRALPGRAPGVSWRMSEEEEEKYGKAGPGGCCPRGRTGLGTPREAPPGRQESRPRNRARPRCRQHVAPAALRKTGHGHSGAQMGPGPAERGETTAPEMERRAWVSPAWPLRRPDPGRPRAWGGAEGGAMGLCPARTAAPGENGESRPGTAAGEEPQPRVGEAAGNRPRGEGAPRSRPAPAAEGPAHLGEAAGPELRSPVPPSPRLPAPATAAARVPFSLLIPSVEPMRRRVPLTRCRPYAAKPHSSRGRPGSGTAGPGSAGPVRAGPAALLSPRAGGRRAGGGTWPRPSPPRPSSSLACRASGATPLSAPRCDWPAARGAPRSPPPLVGMQMLRAAGPGGGAAAAPPRGRAGKRRRAGRGPR